MLTFVIGLLASGQPYFFCRMGERVQATCCCTDKPIPEHASIERADCCERRTHVSLDDALQPVADRIFDGDLLPSLGAPIAVAAVASVSIERVPLPRWTGPPPDRKRALISVFLL
jgi:hypothetical protein